MRKTDLGSFIVPTYSLNISGVEGRVGMDILHFVDRYTAQLDQVIFTTEDTWTFKTIPNKFEMIDESAGSNRQIVCSMNLVTVSLTKTWNVCTNPQNSQNNLDMSLIFSSAVSLAIHD